MRKWWIIVLIVASVVRLLWLGQIPRGLSVEEVQLGLQLSKYIGDIAFNSFILRLPFAILGLTSILLMYLVLQKLGKSVLFSLSASTLFAFMPWHIQISRIYSPGLVALVILIFAIYAAAGFFKTNLSKAGVILFALSVIFFLLSITRISSTTITNVNEERNVASHMRVIVPAVLFSNKYYSSFRENAQLGFEYLDFGNYFFAGHPRERWGVEEIQKLYIVLLPFLIYGLFKSSKDDLLFYSGIFVFLVSLFVYFRARSPEITIPLLFPLTYFITQGLVSGWNIIKNKNVKYGLSGIVLFSLIYEFAIFTTNYTTQTSESMFSPRRSIYEELVPKVVFEKRQGENVLINNRLGSPAPFFQFYSKNTINDDFTFKDYVIKKDPVGNDHLFVDVLSDNASPNEPLYTSDGSWPRDLDVRGEFYDENMKQTVVIYRLK